VTRFEILTAVSTKIQVFWDTATCRLANIYRRILCCSVWFNCRIDAFVLYISLWTFHRLFRRLNNWYSICPMSENFRYFRPLQTLTNLLYPITKFLRSELEHFMHN
jgi:hypothetical protein